MADAASSIFSKKAAEKLRSPDDLDKYLQVTNPSTWVVLGACVALLVGLLAWGLFGAVDTNVTAMGAVISVDKDSQENKTAVCFVPGETVGEISVGDESFVGGERMTVASVNSVPMSADEIRDMLKGDYLTSTLVKGDWAYLVTFEGDVSDLSEGIPLQISITVNRVAPISLIFRDRG